MFYRIKNNKLYDYADYKYAEDCLETDIITQSELDEHPNKMIVNGDILILNPNYDVEAADKREADFKSKFFNIKGFGWYRKQPKGYSSAVESINSAYNSFTEMQKLGLTENFPANTLIFYQQPDFTKPEQCTEAWLIAHQIFSQEMTPQQFGQFYIGFIQAWNTQEH